MGLFLDVWGFAGFLAGLLAATIFFYFFFSEVSCSCVELIQWSTIVDYFAEGFRVLSMVLTDGRCVFQAGFEAWTYVDLFLVRRLSDALPISMASLCLDLFL